MAVNYNSSIVTKNLSLLIDPDKSSTIVGANQLIDNSSFNKNEIPFNTASGYTNVNHLGEIPLGEIVGGTVIFSGADAANYYGQSWQNIDSGSIGTTGGNWRYFTIFPAAADSTKNYIVECGWRFYYVSKTGQGTTNPAFQIGNGYGSRYSKNFSQVGFLWQNARFLISGDSIANQNLTFACTSADSAVQMRYLRVYEINSFYNDCTLDAQNIGSYVSLGGVSGYFDTERVPGTGTSASSVSFCLWVRPQSTSGNIMSMSQHNPQGGWNMPPISAVSQKFTGKMWGNARMESSFYNLNQWYYVCLVFDYSLLKQFLYVNGEKIQETSASYSASGVDNFLYFGQANPGADNAGMFEGDYGQISVYGNKALSGDEIRRNFNALRGRYGV